MARLSGAEQPGGHSDPVTRPDVYMVVGNPIEHSKSPWIHAQFAAQTGQAVSYMRLLVEIGGFAEAMERFQREGGRGCNVTLPFKEDAWQWVTERTERAQRARAVNTVVLREDGITLGDNTDGIGLIRDLASNHGVELSDRRVLILGAGGAARGVIAPVLNENPVSLAIANRTVSKAKDLAEEFSALGAVDSCGFSDLAGLRFDLIINATAAGLSGQMPKLPPDVLAPGACCFDMVYGDRPTAFVQWGREHGAGKTLDGLGMLVEQAAESFFVWRGVRPETRTVISMLRAETR